MINGPDLEDNLFDAAPCKGVQVGTCVMLVDEVIIYAGPIKGFNPPSGCTILLSEVDYALLKRCVQKTQN